MSETSGQDLLDADRLRELADLDPFVEDVQRGLDALTAEAAAEFDLPICLVSIVLDSAQVFAGATGLQGWLAESRGTPVEWAFCKHVVEDGAPFVVTDAPGDARVHGNPLVEHDGVVCYAGVPLTTRQGNHLGSFCVIGGVERTFAEEELTRLHAYADRAVELLERHAAGRS